jgi:hypothetical protein
VLMRYLIDSQAHEYHESSLLFQPLIWIWYIPDILNAREI